ncbi:hypothetical protein HY256_02835 [Candidatus Sumerlaeota bacterium]|nr:hypothetical protein [Candidatus Sumerlaeota bacterium]
MPLFKRRRPDAWNLREGDLPLERDLSAAPELRGMDMNPVFRMLKFRQRSAKRFLLGGSFEVRALAQNKWLNILFPFAVVQGTIYENHQISSLDIPPGAFAFSAALFLVVYAVQQLAGETSRLLTFRSPAVLGLPRICFGDVIQSGVPPRDIAAGVWGLTVGSAFLRRQRAAAVTGIMLSWEGILYFRGQTGYFFLIPLFVCAFHLANLAFSPHHALPLCAMAVRTHRDTVELRLFPSRIFARVSRSVGIAFLVGAAVVSSVLILVWLSGVLHLYQRFPLIDLAQLDYPLLFGLLTTLTAAIGGWLRGRYVRRSAGWYFKRMCADIGDLIEWMRVPLFEKPEGWRRF